MSAAVVPAVLVAFVFVDGLVSGNELAWAGPVRAALVCGVIVAGLAVLIARGVTFTPATAVMIGVLSAFAISTLRCHIAGFGLATWVLYAGAYGWQRIVQRDWRRDFALAGFVVSVCVLSVVLAGVIPPNEAWNRNVIAGTLAVVFPASVAYARGRGASWWGISAVIAAAIVATFSRGAIMALGAGLVVMATERARLSRRQWIALAACALVAFALLVWAKPTQSFERLSFMRGAVDQWAATSLLFGVGPGELRVIAPGKTLVDYHAHNSIVSFAAQVGLVGAVVLGMAASTARKQGEGRGRPSPIARWRLASLAAVSAHSLVDDPATWLPVGIVCALVVASSDMLGVDHEATEK